MSRYTDMSEQARFYLSSCDEIELAEMVASSSARIEQLQAELEEARSWARHGYEIGQRSCTWSDHGVAPAWLTGSPERREETPDA